MPLPHWIKCRASRTSISDGCTHEEKSSRCAILRKLRITKHRISDFLVDLHFETTIPSSIRVAVSQRMDAALNNHCVFLLDVVHLLRYHDIFLHPSGDENFAISKKGDSFGSHRGLKVLSVMRREMLLYPRQTARYSHGNKRTSNGCQNWMERGHTRRPRNGITDWLLRFLRSGERDLREYAGMGQSPPLQRSLTAKPTESVYGTVNSRDR